MQLTNLGLALRPDLFDAHTLHWHGFRNVIPFFDGEPTGSVSVPAGREFTYVYRPRDPGTYMYHCHVEDVEHVHMGMTGHGLRPALQDGQSKTSDGRTYTRFMYNDGDGSTGYDREFAMFLSEVWAEAHWADAHIQLPEWSDYRADFALLNGRVYPDTIAPNGLDRPLQPGSATRRGGPDPACRASRAAVPAAVLAGDLQRGRAGRPAVLQPRFPRGRDDDDRPPDAGRGTRRHAHARTRTAPTPRTRPTRSTSVPARATTSLFTAPPKTGSGPTTPTTSTTARSCGRTTSRRGASVARPPRSTSTRAVSTRRRSPERLGGVTA